MQGHASVGRKMRRKRSRIAKTMSRSMMRTLVREDQEFLDDRKRPQKLIMKNTWPCMWISETGAPIILLGGVSAITIQVQARMPTVKRLALQFQWTTAFG